MIKYIILYNLIAFSIVLAQQPIVTGEDPRYPGSTGNYENTTYDTTSLKMARERAIEANVAMESPIDENEYLMGPGDIITLSISTTKPLQFELPVTPDAKIIIPTIGEVNVRDKTLFEIKKSISSTINKIYKADVADSLKKIRQFKVYIIGAVIRTGVVLANPASRVSDIIDLAGGASTKASKRSVTIFRKGNEILIDLLPFYTNGDFNSNPYVRGGDVIRIGVQDAKNVISCFGAVQRPGEFSFHEGDSISNMIKYCFGFSAGAMLDSIEVVSLNINGKIVERYICKAKNNGEILNNKALKAGDRIFVKFIPNYLKSGRVVVRGEVTFPGSIAIESGQTKLKDVIKQFGGFTNEASLSDVSVIRRKVLSEPDNEFGRIIGIDPKDRSPEEVQYFRAKTREKRGVMSVNVSNLLSGAESENITIEDDDSIFVPTKKTYVKLTGKVKNPGSVTYQKGYNFIDYIKTSGGFGWRADEDETQIIKGRTNEAFLASKGDDYELEPGDAIFVPEKTEATFWKTFTEVISIVAQIATITAVIISLSKP